MDRLSNGHFATGNKIAIGRPKSVFHTHVDTAQRLLESYTYSQILVLSECPEELDKLPTFQAMIVMQLANALKSGKDPLLAIERERLLDRAVGKAAQKISVEQTNINLNYFKISQETSKDIESINETLEATALSPPDDAD